MAAATFAVCKMEVHAEIIYRAVACLMIFNKGSSLFIMYKLLVGNGIQNWFDWFFQYELLCHLWCHCHNSGKYWHYTLMFIDDDNLGVMLFSGHEASFLFLESFSNFVLNLILYIQFLWTNNSVITHPSLWQFFSCW